MADSKSIIALNIGSQRLTMAELAITGSGGLVLKKYESTNILADPAQEMTRLPQVRVAVNELVNKLGVAKEKVNYAISGQSVFTRFVQLPALEDDNIEQLVAFEAQQHVPFPINEVVWDWQLLNSSDGQHEVVLVAIKSDALDDLNDCVIGAGLQTNEVDASPMALANAFKYNYNDLEESALLIDIGARTSNLIYLDGGKIFSRTIAIGGSTVTAAIAKEYNVPFIEAESQKISNGLVSLDTRHTSGLDELTAALGTCIRTALNRMPAEIARTTNFFRSQHGGSAPKKVILAGAGANLPMISDFFQEKLRVPVEFFNPLKRVSVGKDVDVDKVSVEAHILGEIIGLGLRSVEQTKLNVDLVPGSVQEQRLDAKRRPKVIAAAAIAIATCAIYCVTGFTAKSKVAKEQRVAQAALDEVKQYSVPMDKQHKNAATAGKIVSLYGESVKGKTQWLEMLNDLNAHFSTPEIWIVDFEPIVNFDPAKEKQTSFSSDEFVSQEYGRSSLGKLNVAPKLDSKGRPNKKYVRPVINAIKITGYRKNDRNQIVVDRLNLLQEKSAYFTMKRVDLKPQKGKKSRKKKDSLYTLEEIIKENETDKAKGKVAAPFSIILPLTNPIPVE